MNTLFLVLVLAAQPEAKVTEAWARIAIAESMTGQVSSFVNARITELKRQKKKDYAAIKHSQELYSEIKAYKTFLAPQFSVLYRNGGVGIGTVGRLEGLEQFQRIDGSNALMQTGELMIWVKLPVDQSKADVYRPYIITGDTTYKTALGQNTVMVAELLENRQLTPKIKVMSCEVIDD